MSPKKAYYIMLLAVVAFVAIVFAGYYFADKQLAARSSQISDLRAENDALDQYIINANQAQENLDQLTSFNAIIDEVLPDNKIQSNLVGELLAIASSAGVNFNSINFASSQQPGNINFDLSQTEPLKGVPGVNVLRFTVVSDRITYPQLIDLLSKIEANRRKMQVEGVRINPELNQNGTATGTISTELTINVYVRIN